jgi:hypothetical protein
MTAQFEREKENHYLSHLAEDRFFLTQKWWGGSSWHDKRPRAKYIFVVGCGHSGTTIMLRILSDHPDIHGIPKESSLFAKPSDSLILRGLLEWENEAKNRHKNVILEKTPDHLFYVNKINEFVPNSHIICMVRDGRDVLASLLARGWTYARAANYWLSCMEYMDEVKAKSSNLSIVKLEDFVKDPPNILQDILEGVGLDNSADIIDYMLRYHERPVNHDFKKVELPENGLEGENHEKLRNYQVHQPLFKETTRWRKDLSAEAQQELTNTLGHWLNEYGYSESDNRDCKAA